MTAILTQVASADLSYDSGGSLTYLLRPTSHTHASFAAMSLRLKFILILIFEVAVAVALAGFLIVRQSNFAVIDLARELLVANTDRAFALCESYIHNSPLPSVQLRREISDVQIARNGYIAVLGGEKGVLIVHPSDVGKVLYNDDFPHIMALIDEIKRNENRHGYSNFISYRQGTQAQGRQGETKIGYYKYFEPWDWVILATGYERDVFSSRHELRKAVTPVILAIIFLGGIIVYVTVGRLLAPIKRLTDTTKEVAKGNWEVSINYDSKDEIGLLATSFNIMVRSLKDNARVLHEFDVAKDMQAEMLPKKYPDISGVRIGAMSMPATEIGGDFYDFLDLGNGRFGLVVGDVSGHGVSAAMIMTVAISTIRYVADEKQSTNEVLARVNSRLKKDIRANMFVALFYGIFDSSTRRLYYTNAGLTMPYVLRNGDTWFLPRAPNTVRFPLGLVDSPNYEQLSIDLQSGDTLVLYTDGVVEAMDSNSQIYGFDRLAKSIKQNANRHPEEMIESLISEVNPQMKF